METKTLERQNRMLHHLAQLPRLMIDVHGRDNISEFILHELCSEPCFNLRKAAYLVDNPDFNCLRGVAGFARIRPIQGKKFGKILMPLASTCKEPILIIKYDHCSMRALLTSSDSKKR